ncbi:MAG: NAD(+) synthase, partial [Candidatus Ureaplasma intestinipullorum]|nr:NAD(+) synthase [Candidatus Ureaplasma intestinipullorum]
IWKDTINSFQINDKFNSYNIKSKIRSMFLFSQAFEKDGLVISNLNYDEYYLGYFTKFGDSNGDVFPLLNLTKQDIIEVAKYLELPNEIINKLPSADLYINQNDENEFGFSYKDLDEYLNFKKINPNIENKIIKRVEKNKHKRILEHLINNDFRKE